MPAVSVLMKPSSGMCNMSCSYCFYCDETQKREREFYGFMSEQTLKNVIRKTMAHAEGMISYAYQGGEPTLRGIEFFRKAVEYQKQYNRKGLQVQNALQTNGLLINKEWCRFLSENHFLVGISVDGIQKTHDAYRHDREGKGTYEKVSEVIRMFDEYGVAYNILTVVHQETASHIAEIYREYQKKGWNYQQYIACLDPLDELHGKSAYALRPEAYGMFLKDLFELWYEDVKKGTQPYIRQFENYIGILLGYRPEACDQRGFCGIQYVVEADGSVYPCDFYMLDEYRMGNLNKDRMTDIDQERENIGFIRKSLRIDPKCIECPYYRLCKGGCQRHRDLMPDGEFYQNYFCRSFRMFFEHCGERMQNIADILKKTRSEGRNNICH